MKAATEFLAFLGVASGLHLLPWIGDASGGRDGAAPLTAEAPAPAPLSVASPAVAALVEAWETPPEIAAPPALTAPRVPVEATLTGAPDTVPQRPEPSPALLRPQATQTPRAADRPMPLSSPAVQNALAQPAMAIPREMQTPLRPSTEAPPRAEPPAPPTLPRSEYPVNAVPLPAPLSDLAPEVSSRPTARPADLSQPRTAPRSVATTPPAPQTPSRRTTPASQAAPAQAGPTAAQIQAMMSEWGGGIRGAIERRIRYPRGTTASGQVSLRLTVSTSGQLAALALTGSSGDAALDRAAIAAVQSARLPAAPRGMPDGPQTFSLSFTLRP